MQRNFAGALEFLLNARSPQAGRPCQNNTRVVFASVDGQPAVGIKFHHTVVVAYLPDGTTVLNSGGWHTVSTCDRINTYSPAMISTDFRWKPNGEKHTNFKTWVVRSSPFATTPEKPQPCRSCRGTGLNAAQGRCWNCVGRGVKDYGSKLVCPSFEDGVQVDSAGVVVGYVGAPHEMHVAKGEYPTFVTTQRFERLQSEHLPIDIRHVADSARISREFETTGRVLMSQPSRGMGNVPVISPDAQSVEFSRMSAEAQAEMDEWDKILRGGK